ncbi:uncharacterized protein LOC130666998 isoform X2 [Microplitis mediator]|uniref:uncharacterized protein LOC130666998 isoform X2 n=1 Tax=Microplitis mediator TaxID=375433 RepID=UPI002554DAA8|nr:uncharacterized protein LOC130666998 isoform X2 [Microplitis mediator]
MCYHRKYVITNLLLLLSLNVELTNGAGRPVTVQSKMINCCEIITPEDVDCEHIRLIEDHVGILPGETANVTLIWPTPYLHDRRGECEIGITYNSTDGTTNLLREKIPFDTYVSNHSVPDILRGYYETSEVKRCASVDEDSLESCQPVNCFVKYGGKRNFYNQKLRKCEPAFLWISDSTQSADANIICHNGRRDNVTGTCVCKEGWRSQRIDSLKSTADSIHMCNFRVSPFPRAASGSNATTSLVILTVIILSLLIFFLCCAMTVLTQNLPPPGARIEYRSILQQTSGPSSIDGSLERLIPISSRMDERKRMYDNFDGSYTRLTY